MRGMYNSSVRDSSGGVWRGGLMPTKLTPSLNASLNVGGLFIYLFTYLFIYLFISPPPPECQSAAAASAK